MLVIRLVGTKKAFRADPCGSCGGDAAYAIPTPTTPANAAVTSPILTLRMCVCLLWLGCRSPGAIGSAHNDPPRRYTSSWRRLANGKNPVGKRLCARLRGG